MSAARSARAGRSSSRLPDRTTCCSRARRAPARRCSRAACPGILPRLDPEEALEVTRIHSVSGLLSREQPLVRHPPFRAPHHSASMAALVGGGRAARPGEVSLAHRGVLLLDELPEFQRQALEALRQPIEDGVVSVARAEGRAVYPARFQLIATMNLCPCGARGDPAQECSCSTQRLASYRERLSRALLDRFDLVVTVPRPRATELAADRSEASAAVAERIAAARRRIAAERAAPHARGRRAPLTRRRATAALGPRPCPGRARRQKRRRTGRLRCRSARACRRGARLPLAA